MEQRTLEEYIASLDPYEREEHQAVIKECLERKKIIWESKEKIYKSTEQIAANINLLHNGLNDLEKSCKIHTDLMDSLVIDIRPLLLSLVDNKPSTN